MRVLFDGAKVVFNDAASTDHGDTNFAARHFGKE